MSLGLRLFISPRFEQVAEDAFKSRAALRENIDKEIDRFALATVATIKERYLSGGGGDILRVRTGRLRSSIQFSVDETSPDEREVTFGTDVPYAAIHEFGGQAGRNHATTIRARPFLSRGVADMLPIFEKNLEKLLDDFTLGAS